MAETFSTFDFNVGSDNINYDGLPDVQSRVDIISVGYRDGDIALKHGKRSEPFGAIFTAFSDAGGSTAFEKYAVLLSHQGTIATLSTWQADFTNVLLEMLSPPAYKKVILDSVATDMMTVQISFRKMQ